jgi:hypothetical protein
MGDLFWPGFNPCIAQGSILYRVKFLTVFGDLFWPCLVQPGPAPQDLWLGPRSRPTGGQPIGQLRQGSASVHVAVHVCVCLSSGVAVHPVHGCLSVSQSCVAPSSSQPGVELPQVGCFGRKKCPTHAPTRSNCRWNGRLRALLPARAARWR